MLKDKWLNQGFGPVVHIVQRGENQNSVPERKNITSNRILPLLDKMDKMHKTPPSVDTSIGLIDPPNEHQCHRY